MEEKQTLNSFLSILPAATSPFFHYSVLIYTNINDLNKIVLISTVHKCLPYSLVYTAQTNPGSSHVKTNPG